jgi:phosphatidate cytidylyltransferase
MASPHGIPLHHPDLEWVTRPLFGLLLAVVAIGVLLAGPLWLACALTLVGGAAAREWHRLVGAPDAALPLPLARFRQAQVGITTLALAVALALLLGGLAWAGLVALAAGAVLSFVLAARGGDNPAWHAAGVFYVGLPAMALVSLRAADSGFLIVLGFFLIVWATDTGALVAGKLIGGPRLAPRLSPGKTWAGTIGGSVAAAAVYGLYIGILGFPFGPAVVFALLLSVMAHGGDLLESAIKRRFGKKDTGTMIPGHGGILDRMDSSILASVVLALLVSGVHFSPLFGGFS